MTRYYLHVSDGIRFTEDSEGAEYADLDAARLAAIAGLRDILAGEMQRGELDLGSLIEIEDEGRTLMMTVPFAAAVNVS